MALEDSPVNGRTLILVNERVDQLRTRFEELMRRVERSEAAVQDLAVLPIQVAGVREDIGEIKRAIEGLARKTTDREQWLESFRLQASGLAENKQQNIKSGMLTVIVLGAGLVSTVLGILANALLRTH